MKKDEMNKCEGEFEKRSFQHQTNILNVRNSELNYFIFKYMFEVKINSYLLASKH
jgi:hypothetical protein